MLSAIASVRSLLLAIFMLMAGGGFMATLIAGFWSLMSGMVLVMALQACGLC